jgi:RNA polymerase sigma factor (sigma-70 family)
MSEGATAIPTTLALTGRERATRAIELRPVEAVYRSLAPAVLGYLRSQGASDPEDLTGEVFVDVTRGLHRFVGDDLALRRWVFTIAHRRLIDDRRRRKVRRDHARDEPAEGVEPDVVDASLALDPELLRALDALTPLQREVVVLRFVADLPIADVARIVRRPRTAVKALQTRGLAHLEATLR